MSDVQLDAQNTTAIQPEAIPPQPKAEGQGGSTESQGTPAAPAGETPAQPAAKVPDANAGKPADNPVEFKWSEDWRERMARGNDNLAKRLSRYSSPEAVAEALANAQEKISSGQLKTPAPKDNPEALARWREENGIPQKWEDYDVAELASGIVLGEEDMQGVNGFLQEMHKNNVHPDVVKSAVSWYKQFEMEQFSKISEADKQGRTETQQELMAEWGANFPSEVNSIRNFLKSQGLEDIEFARTADGRMVGNNPELIRKLSALARDINPAATVVPGSGNAMQSITKEIADIESRMGTTKYTSQDANRYMELITARDKISARQAG